MLSELSKRIGKNAIMVNNGTESMLQCFALRGLEPLADVGPHDVNHLGSRSTSTASLAPSLVSAW